MARASGRARVVTMDWARLLEAVRDGELSVEAALGQLSDPQGFLSLDDATLDTQRVWRQGFPEAIYAGGKSPEQVAQLMTELSRRDTLALATRADGDHNAAVRSRLPDVEYDETARVVWWGQSRSALDLDVLVVSAGTSDEPIAAEAARCAQLLGCRIDRLTDVGVAGVHRLFQRVDTLRAADAIIVVAGMDGALPSLVGGLVAVPVIAVPTSQGYGASLQGLAPLLTMLNSCAPGVAVVNVDNGFGAASMAARIGGLNRG